MGKLLGVAAKSGEKYAELAEKANLFKQIGETVYSVGSGIKELSEENKDKIGLYTLKNYYGGHIGKDFWTKGLIYASKRNIDEEELTYNLFIIDQLLEGATIEGINEEFLNAFKQAQNEVMGKEVNGRINEENREKVDMGE